MDNKYYTPDILEFCVGFEYEFHGMSKGDLVIIDFGSDETTQISEPNIKVWTKEVLDDNTNPLGNNRSLSDIKKLIDNKQIRVKYLEQEDIESFGFEFTQGTLYDRRDNVVLQQGCKTMGAIERSATNLNLCNNPKCCSCRMYDKILKEEANKFLTENEKFMNWDMSISKTEEGKINYEHLSTSSQIRINKDDQTLHLNYNEFEDLIKLIERIKQIGINE